MPRQFLKKFLPHPDKIKKNKFLRIFNKYLHAENLWHLHRHSVAKAVAIGFFCMFLPMPLQMVLSAGIAIILQANILIAAVIVWISNPFTIPIFLYVTYETGRLFFHEHSAYKLSDIHHLLSNFSHVWEPLVLGSIICGTVAAIIAYFGVNFLWKFTVRKKWRERAEKRRNKHHS